MDTTWPKISIVTVSFNQGEFIRQNIESVLGQNYPNFEHIIVDGGSTDGTLDILKSYPHLKWTSEPDNGQSDGLNRGFARTSGEIVGWLNSDDWYAPNIFFEVAEALRDYPVVIGAGQETDKDGTPRQVVPNTERNFFDILKYWVPFAWLAQPPIFFRKELLERTKRPDGKYLDEGLYFCMDYDLWARMSAIAPFTKRLDKILAYNRMYDINKTGKHPIATQRECGRVFRRQAMTLSGTEHKFSIIIPAQSISPKISQTMMSIAAQRMRDCEVIFVDYSGSKEFGQKLHDVSLELAAAFDHNSIRFLKSREPHLYSAIHSGIEAACAPLVITLQEGDTIGPEFLIEAADLFLPDCQGLALPLSSRPDIKKMLCSDPSNPIEIRPSAIFRLPYIFPNFVIRKVAMLELGGFKYPENPPLALRELLARILHNSWSLSVENTLSLTPVQRENRSEEALLSVMEPWINARILRDLDHEREVSTFTKVRFASGNTLPIPEPVRKRAQQVLELAPAGWEQMQFLKDWPTIVETCRNHPHFAPAWFFLARSLEHQGDTTGVAEAKGRFEETLARQRDWY